MAWAACCVFSINSGCSTRSFIRAATACGSCRPLSKVTQEIQMAYALASLVFCARFGLRRIFYHKPFSTERAGAARECSLGGRRCYGLAIFGRHCTEPAGRVYGGSLGAEKQLLGLSFAAAIAMLGIGLEWLWISAVAVGLLTELVIPMVSPIVAMQNPGPARVEALAACTVWRDLGAGIGPMLAGALLPIGSNLILYTGAAAMIAVSVIACYFELKK